MAGNILVLGTSQQRFPAIYVCDTKLANGVRPATLQWERQQSVILAVNELILTALAEHCVTLPLIKNVKFLMLRVKSNIFVTILKTRNMQETNLYYITHTCAG
jgi:hypothetical protein